MILCNSLINEIWVAFFYMVEFCFSDLFHAKLFFLGGDLGRIEVYTVEEKGTSLIFGNKFAYQMENYLRLILEC